MKNEPLNIHDEDRSIRRGPPGWLTIIIIFGAVFLIVITVMFLYLYISSSHNASGCAGVG